MSARTPPLSSASAEVQLVFDVHRLLLDVRSPVEVEQLAAPAQVIGQQAGQKGGVRCLARTRAVQIARIRHRRAACVKARGVVRGIGDAQPKGFRQRRLINVRADLQALDALRIREVLFHAEVGQAPRLLQRSRLVIKQIRRRVVVHLVLPHIDIRAQQRRRIENVGPEHGSVKALDLVALVLS